MNNFLLTLAGLLLAVLCALFAVPPLIDWNQYRGVFEEEVSRFLGREVRVGGDVRLRILPVPYVGFDQVHIADAPGVSGPFVQAGRFTLWLAVPPLLRGVIEANRIEIAEPTLRLRLDEKGGGNWQSMRFSDTGLPFVPRQIALQSVNIVSGRLIVENAAGDAIVRLQGIDGELSAAALSGPYKFTGHFGDDAMRQELRLSTSRTAADSSMRIKAAVRGLATKSSTVIDGTLRDISSAPTFAGTFRVRGGNDLLVSGSPPRTAAPDSGKRRFFEATGVLTADARGAQLAQMTVSFDSAGRPQLLQGSAEATWRRELQIRSRLTSRWLDLDAIFGLDSKASPLAVLEAFLARRKGIGETGGAVIDIAIDQANLGGAAIGDVLLRFGRSGNAVRLERLHAALPGGARLTGDGVVGDGKAGTDFDGHIILKVANLRRFAEWARLPIKTLRGRAATAFALKTSVKYTPGTVLLENLTAETGGGTVRGDAQWAWGSKPRMTVDLDVSNVDLYGFGDNLLSSESLATALGIRAAANGASNRLSTDHPAHLLAGVAFRVHLDGTDIRDGQRHIKTLDLTVNREGEQLKIERAKFELATALSADVSGLLKVASSGQPTGKLEGIVSAASAAGLRDLVGAIAVAANTTPPPEAFGRAFPLRLAVMADLGKPGAGATRLTADGEIRGDRIRLKLVSGGAPSQWRSLPLRLSARVEGRDAARTVWWIRGDSARPEPAAAAGQPPVSLQLEVAGRPAEGLAARVYVDSAPLTLRVHADAKLSAGDQLTWQGHAIAEAADLAAAAQVFAAELLPMTGRVAAAGRIDLARLPSETVLSPRAFMIGGTRVEGRIALAPPKSPQQHYRLTANLALDQAHLRNLLAPLTRTSPAATTNASPQPEAGFWSDSPFDFTALANVEGHVALNIASLDVGQGLKAGKAALIAELAPSQIKVTKFEGNLLGGSFGVTATLASAPAGATLDGALKLTGITLQDVATLPLAGRLAGMASASVTIKGTALSPRAMIATMRGKGTATLQQTILPGLAPQILSELADNIVGGKVDAAEIGTQITAATRISAVRLGDARVDLSVADGALLIGRLETGQASPRAENRTTVDLLRLAADSEWRIWPKLSASPDIAAPKPLPEIRIVYTSPLRSLPSAVATVALGSLERELTVRRMEADVARLERLRREDEARAKAEAERLRRLEEEQQRALEAERLRRQQEQQPQPGAAPQASPGLLAPAPVRARPPLPPATPQPAPGDRTRDGNAAPLPGTTTPPLPQPAAAPPTIVTAPRRPPRRKRSSWSPNRVLEQLSTGAN